MKVYIIQEKYDYESCPHIIDVYENEYDALFEIAKLEHENKYTKYQITESETIKKNLTKIEYEDALLRENNFYEKKILKDKIADCDKIRDKYNKILEIYKSKVTILEQNIYNANKLYIENRDTMSTTEVRDIIEQNKTQITKEYRKFKDNIYNSDIKCDIIYTIWDLIDNETYELLY